MMVTHFAKVYWSYIVFAIFISSIYIEPIQATYIIKNGSFYNAEYLATASCEEHLQAGCTALAENRLQDAEREFKIVEYNFSKNPCSIDVLYYLGVIKLEQAKLDIANRYFSSYVSKNIYAQYYEKAFRYKLSIAKRLAQGEKRHLFGYEGLPRIISDKQLALDILNEIIKLTPHIDLAAQSFLEKGNIFIDQETYLDAVDCYRSVIRSFPGTPYALTAFQSIALCYSKLLEKESQNNDTLILAEINLIEAKKMFHHENEIQKIITSVEDMKEHYALSLLHMGNLYERMHQPKAAVMCYLQIVDNFAITQAATASQERLQQLMKYTKEITSYVAPA